MDEILELAVDDWIQAAEITSVAIVSGGASGDSEIRATSLAVVRELLGRDLMGAGAVTEHGLTPWGLSAEESLARIECDWPTSGTPELGEVFWLDLTEAA